MQIPFNQTVEHGRILGGVYGSSTGDPFGAFMFEYNGVQLHVLANAANPHSYGWEHVSVSTADRTPTWEEMCFIKSLFFKPHEWVVQFHPAEMAYVNYHPHTLHLWRHSRKPFPTPPSILVGPKT